MACMRAHCIESSIEARTTRFHTFIQLSLYDLYGVLSVTIVSRSFSKPTSMHR